MTYPIDQLDNLLKADYYDMLTIQELSIGDWLQKTIEDPRHEGEKVTVPVQIRGMFTDAAGQDNIIYYHPVEGIEISTLLRHLAPIPISYELVRGCGAVLEEVGDNGQATPPQFRARFEKWGIKTQWKDGTLWYDRHTHKWSLAGANQVYLDYVHQLQHVLRLSALPWSIDPQEVFAPWLKTYAE